MGFAKAPTGLELVVRTVFIWLHRSRRGERRWPCFCDKEAFNSKQRRQDSNPRYETPPVDRAGRALARPSGVHHILFRRLAVIMDGIVLSRSTSPGLRTRGWRLSSDDEDGCELPKQGMR